MAEIFGCQVFMIRKPPSVQKPASSAESAIHWPDRHGARAEARSGAAASARATMEKGESEDREHHDRRPSRMVAGEGVVLDRKDLAHEKQGAEECFPFAPAEPGRPPIEAAEDGDAHQHEKRAADHARAGPAPAAEGDPEGDHDGIELGEEGRGRSGGVAQAVGLQQHPAGGEDADPAALPELPAGPAAALLRLPRDRRTDRSQSNRSGSAMRKRGPEDAGGDEGAAGSRARGAG